MDRLTSRELRTLLKFLRQIYALTDLNDHAANVVATLSKVIPAEITGYTQADLRPRRAKWSVVSRPDLNNLKSGVRELVERHLEGNPVVPYYLRTLDSRAVTISDFLTRRQFRRLPIYGEYYRSMGVEYQLSVPLQTSPDTLSRVSVSRDRRDFSSRERLLLDLLRPHLLQAYRNTEALTGLRRENAALHDVLGTRGQELVRLCENERLGIMTARGRQWLATYFNTSSRQDGILPDTLRRWLRRQQSSLHMTDDVPPAREPLTIERDGARLVVRLFSGAQDSFLLLEEQHTSLDPRRLEALGLSRREAEVLSWVSQGKTSEETATILGLSRRTVEKHLENIYPKLGVENRTAAAARALEVLTPAAR